MSKSTAPKTASRLSEISEAARLYGERSFDNYAQIRSVAEQLRDGLCKWLDDDLQCVYLVPPQGEFGAQNYRSAAFSVSGKGFLPLEPISFGLAINISGEGDYMRLVLTCRKEGEKMFVHIEEGSETELALPLEPEQLTNFYGKIHEHLLDWFNSRIDHYDNGRYGNADIGFDIMRANS